ncbi:MAG: hypothetical protein ACLS8T_20895, partial [Anaerobutyricum sp.]
KNKNFGKTSPKFLESKFHSAKSQNSNEKPFLLYFSFEQSEIQSFICGHILGEVGANPAPL